MADLQSAFLAFASYGTREAVSDMDSRSLVKLCKDSGIIGGGFTTTDIDLIFTKVAEKGKKRISYGQFCTAVQEIATRKKVSKESIEAKIAAASPSTNATQADYVKFHDDKSTYTGVHVNGGPTTIDKMAEGGLAHLLDRSPADVRGVKK